mgnify:CR=1 FL=1
MKIIIDNKIPYIKEAVRSIADEVVYAPGKGFSTGTGTGCGCAYCPYPYTLQP